MSQDPVRGRRHYKMARVQGIGARAFLIVPSFTVQLHDPQILKIPSQTAKITRLLTRDGQPIEMDGPFLPTRILPHTRGRARRPSSRDIHVHHSGASLHFHTYEL